MSTTPSFSRYPNSSVFADANSFRTWVQKHRPTTDSKLGDNLQDSLAHALIRHGGTHWMTPDLWSSFGFDITAFKAMSRQLNQNGDTAFHVAMSLEDEQKRTQAVNFCLSLDPALVQIPHGSPGHTQSTLIRFLDVWADRQTPSSERPSLRRLLEQIHTHGGDAPCYLHPLQFVTCRDTLDGILPNASHPIFKNPPNTLCLVRESVHRTMRGMSEAWKGKFTDVLSLRETLVSNHDIAKKLRGWLFEEGTLERLNWWAASTGISLEQYTIQKGRTQLSLSEHLAKMASVRSQGLPWATKTVAAQLFLQEQAKTSLKAFNESFFRVALSETPCFRLSDFKDPLPYSLDSLFPTSTDLFSDALNTPVSHTLVAKLFSPALPVSEKTEIVSFLAVNSESVQWRHPLQAKTESQTVAPDSTLVDALRAGIQQVLLETDRPHNSPHLSPHHVKAEIQNALSRLERSLLLDRVAPQLQQKSTDTFAL